MNAVRSNAMLIRKALATFRVPVMTIQNTVSGQISDLACRDTPTALPPDVEEQLATKIKAAAQQGFGLQLSRVLGLQLSRVLVCSSAGFWSAVHVARLVRRLQLKTSFRNCILGKDWISVSVKRHLDLSVRSPTALSTVRARMLNPSVTQKYFEQLDKTLTSIGVKDVSVKIWNIDETSVPLLHKPTHVIAAKRTKNIPGSVGNNLGSSLCACRWSRNTPSDNSKGENP